ncbi:37S ribosomal protein S22 [Myotisia sp. PD_48]|nr:37S ribosomal protein S22 [Myotisia sp. PD_48]
MLSSRSTAKVRIACSRTSLQTLPCTFIALRPLLSSPPRALSTIALASAPRFSRNFRKQRVHNGIRFNSSAGDLARSSGKHEVYEVIDKLYKLHEEIVEDMIELAHYQFPRITSDAEVDLEATFSSIVGYRDQEELESRVRVAWEEFGVFLPPGELHSDGLKLYRRLYGEPVFTKPAEEPNADQQQIFREDRDGVWGLVDMAGHNTTSAESGKLSTQSDNGNDTESDLLQRSLEVAEHLGADLHPIPLPVYDSEDPYARSHPLAAEGKFETYPRSITLPTEITSKIKHQLSSGFSNKQLSEAAYQVFGGERLPNGIAVHKLFFKDPIPLTPSQQLMSPLDASLFLAVLYPGIYAATLSIMTEIRKRLGTKWIRELIHKEGGPHVLDAGGAGAGVLAWREIVRSEWSLMYPNHPEDSPLPMGKSTVLTGSDTLRHQASRLLENTSYIPRLPDYLRLEESSLGPNKPANRKNYDIIIAPHELMHFQENHQRKRYVQNLWAMLNPNGGILILLEKGHKNGFAAIAGARDMILERLILSPESISPELSIKPLNDDQFLDKGKGMIIAPCTTHNSCPMYVDPGSVKRPKQLCGFPQRYVRPDFLQNILKRPSHNHEDVELSYLAVQRGVDRRETDGIVQSKAAADSAFEGFENTVAATPEGDSATEVESTVQDSPNPLSWPRIILPPLKRKNHVTMDVCTPAGKLERWVVPRSFSRQAYRDARKSSWGDLWPLGAKTRVHRTVEPVKSENDGMGHLLKPKRMRHRKQPVDDSDEPLFEDVPDDSPQSRENEFAKNMMDYHKKRIMGQRVTNKPPNWIRKAVNKRQRKYSKQVERIL